MRMSCLNHIYSNVILNYIYIYNIIVFFQICDVVVVSRLLNATLVIPEIQSTTSKKGIRLNFLQITIMIKFDYSLN